MLGVTVGVPVGPVVGTVVGTTLGLAEGNADGTVVSNQETALPRVPLKAQCLVFLCDSTKVPVLGTAIGVTLG